MTVSNLPVQLTHFIGREQELEAVERLVSTSRLITLTGAGGCGKTRLAIQVANDMSVSAYYPRHKCVALRWIGEFRPV